VLKSFVMQLLQRWASCHRSFAGAIAAAAMPALLATGLTASPVFRKQPVAVYPVIAFPGWCCSEKKNVLVVSSVGSRRSSSSIIASSSDNTPAAGLISSINNEQIGKHSAHVTDQLYQYILQHTREPKVCALFILTCFPFTDCALPKCCFSPEELS
jgi:hypothetical protein